MRWPHWEGHDREKNPHWGQFSVSADADRSPDKSEAELGGDNEQMNHT